MKYKVIKIKYKPIIFSRTMVIAILENRKFQTRRLGVSWGKVKPRDVLRVKEKWKILMPPYPGIPIYEADYKDKDTDDQPWNNPLFMPRWASRIYLMVTGKREELLRNITDSDAVREGIIPVKDFHGRYISPRNQYASLWDNMHKKKGFGWDTNPTVKVIDFEVVK